MNPPTLSPNAGEEDGAPEFFQINSKNPTQAEAAWMGQPLITSN